MSNLETNLACTCNPFILRRNFHAAILTVVNVLLSLIYKFSLIASMLAKGKCSV